MEFVKSAGVYCSSFNGLSEKYQLAAKEVGTLLAKNNIKLVYGGGRMGLMGLVSNATLEAGGSAIGISTTLISTREGINENLHELMIVETMHERKQLMFEKSEAFVILPGGIGTLDETFEIMTWKQIGLHHKKIIFLDIDGYWSAVFESHFKRMIEDGFVREIDQNLFIIAKTPDEVIYSLCNGIQPDQGYVAKWV
ncbi:MAG: TIGR00730 family Rossman fold protein [Candidatus Paracaedimonas acanthamoebae]|uniref:Cytokinin riboside 5'-monophosphate phosphoribohydrolase n=1 Tax=Candidatus Paracaedimonas acanthamoebae TaxID=244581 RepID=A0A8J7TTK5_9PROT|nr:TIGR00730 family Rossman fold protein [Candidatus Paracaedimonas acanthamoebae]